MDILCVRCGEPFDVYHVEQDMAKWPERPNKEDFYTGRGCDCCYGKEVENIAPEACEIQRALRDVLGDDVDGLAAEMEDLGLV